MKKIEINNNGIDGEPGKSGVSGYVGGNGTDASPGTSWQSAGNIAMSFGFNTTSNNFEISYKGSVKGLYTILEKDFSSSAIKLIISK